MLQAYRSRTWSCVYSGKGGMTYVEALKHEEKYKGEIVKVGQSGLQVGFTSCQGTPRFDEVSL